MTVKILSNSTKKRIVEEYHTDCSVTKMALAKKYKVSARTIGRVLNEYCYDNSCGCECEPQINEAVEFSFTATNDIISITRIVIDLQTQIVKSTQTERISKGTDAQKFDEIIQYFLESFGQDTNVICQTIWEKISVAEKIEKATIGELQIDGKNFTVKHIPTGIHFSGKLVNRLVSIVNNNNTLSDSEILGIVNFAEKLLENPSNRAVTELYDFLEAMDIKITESGYVECFKKVTDEYLDCYTKTMDNSPGKIVSISRNQVDENSEQTCSYGLHVCSKAYLNSYPGKKIIKVLVHPKDFVSIPKDYYSLDGDGNVKAKARVCAYKVVADVSKEFTEYCY